MRLIFHILTHLNIYLLSLHGINLKGFVQLLLIQYKDDIIKEKIIVAYIIMNKKI